MAEAKETLDPGLQNGLDLPLKRTHKKQSIASKIKTIIFRLLSAVIPPIDVGHRLRAVLLRCFGAKTDFTAAICSGLCMQGFDLTLAAGVFINENCFFDCSAPIILGPQVQIGQQVSFITTSHQIGSHQRRAGTHTYGPIVVGQGSWIGARSVILSGVTIGEGVVVAAGSVVIRDIPPDTLVAGVPAQIKRKFDTDDMNVAG